MFARQAQLIENGMEFMSKIMCLNNDVLLLFVRQTLLTEDGMEFMCP